MHLIESAHTGHATAGVHSFLSISVHAAVVLAALYATMQPVVEREPVPDPRVYFVPEQRPATVVPSTPQAKPVAPKRVAPAAALAKAVAAPTIAPVSIPAVDVPLADPSAAAPAEPSASASAGTASGDAGQSARSGPYVVGEVEIPAAALSKSGPEYPERAIRLALSGAVRARFIVDARGRVESNVVILESTSDEFTSAVRSYLRRARYRPARVGGRPVRQLVEQRFVFELRG
ncbi:MAG: TonB family protein [Gemmatimonadaceae bacterium]|nr:TonB family protein [Gemmatimonadaceae bacterium]